MQNFKVTKKEEGERLDLFLTKKMKVSRKKVKDLLDSGRVFLKNKKVIIASWKIKDKDLFEIYDEKTAPQKKLSQNSYFLKIAYEDKDLIVIEKPAGVSCERTPQITGSTLVDTLNDYFRRIHGAKGCYLGLMHRLDIETSGLMVYSKSKRANTLSKQFKEHSIKRKYLCILKGKLMKSNGTLKGFVGKDPENLKRKKVFLEKEDQNKWAVTKFVVLERYPEATLVEAELFTGRTHQVRLHFASIGHPLLGDKVYGTRGSLKRQALHAAYLEFQHPVTQKVLKFKSPLPKDLDQLLQRLREKV